MSGMKQNEKIIKQRIKYMEKQKIMLKISELLMKENLITADEKLRLVHMIQQGDKV